MTILRTAAFITLLLASSSAFPFNLFHHAFDQLDGLDFKDNWPLGPGFNAQIKSIVENSKKVSDAAMANAKIQMDQAKTQIDQARIQVENGKSHVRINFKIIPNTVNSAAVITHTLPENNGNHGVPTAVKTPSTVLSNKLSSNVHPELPLPVIPNFSTVAAPLGTSDLHILGLLPKSEKLNSSFLWVGDIQIPQNVQMVMLLPVDDQIMPANFLVLVVMCKGKPLPPNAQILTYNFPPLRSPEGFFNPIKDHILAIPFESISSNYSSYLGLGLLPNSHRLSNVLSTAQQIQQVQAAKAAEMNVTITIPSTPQLPIPPNQPSQPAATLPPQILPSPLDEFGVVHAIEEFTAKYPGVPLLQLPDNFLITGVRPENILASLGKKYPLILLRKPVSPSPDYLILKGPPHHNETDQPWGDFQLVAKTDTNPLNPPFFLPLILVSVLQNGLSNNELRLPIFVNLHDKVEKENVTSIFQVVLLLNQLEPPTHPYFIMCMAPSENPTNKNSSDPDAPDNPAIHPRFLPSTSTTTSIPIINKISTSTTIAPVTEPVRGNKPVVAGPDIAGSKSEKKPLPSKKSWKNRLPPYRVTVEPSVKVVKREPAKANENSFVLTLQKFLGF